MAQNDTPSTTLFDRTLQHLHRVWLGFTSTRSDQIELSPELPDEQLPLLQQWLEACLKAEGGEVAARARAAQLGEAYLQLDGDGRRRFLLQIAAQFDCDDEAIEQAISHWQHSRDDERVQARQQLRQVLEPPRIRLLRQFTELPEGVKFLVDMRAELLLLRKEEPALAALELDLRHLLTHWFDIGLLKLEQISWHSPAELLEKLIDYEAVHAIQSWEDLKNRLESDRRCFAFFHPNMPGEPLIFVEVALVNGMASNVQVLLDEDAPILDLQQADTAIFYSISNAQPGLAGISFGNFLIKRVVALLQQEFAGLKQFATLSPVPGFCRWLAQQDDEHCRDLHTQLLQPQWWQNDSTADGLQTPLMQQAARYLARERRGERALDPVAHFHLSNGAELARINWQADLSERGLKQSAGLMVNYHYRLEDVEQNSQHYLESAKVSTGNTVAALLDALD
ncbi:MAG: malonyl-CoA decarboxylase [Marinobacterium sp.]|nr:malonyl-CoA decarboxylase [Marinobacterium sp.]